MCLPDVTIDQLYHMDMDLPVVSVSLGTAAPLHRQLHSLPTGRRRPEGVTEVSMESFKEEVEKLCKSLTHVSTAIDPSLTAKCWMKEVREICYDTEDYFYFLEVMHSRSRSRSGAGRSPSTSPISRIHKRLMKRRHHSAKDFSDLTARVKDAAGRHERFKLKLEEEKSYVNKQAWTPIPVHGGRRTVVGIEERMNKLTDMLGGAVEYDDRLKVVPIFGAAGVGKSLLASTLYRKFGRAFECRAFLQVSRHPDMRRLLTSVLSQIKAPPVAVSGSIHDLVGRITAHLQDKRYLIVIDDIWSASTWDIISRAFPKGYHRSRIITTTEIRDVALACSMYPSYCRDYSNNGGYIFMMEPLNVDQSTKLFLNRVFGSEDDCPQDLKEVASGIIQKCGGLPLATVTMAGLLASDTNPEEWKRIQDSLPSTLMTSPTSEGMKDVLNIIYNNLSSQLKTCLLYLCMYPEGYEIKKNDLVKQWIAEGFITVMEGQDTEQIAGGYFDELVCRGIIEPVHTTYNEEVLSCTVHHKVLDFVRSKSMEENFITTVDYGHTTPGLPDKVRRLSLQFGGAKSADIPENIRASHARSLLFSGFFRCVPSIPDYVLLQVLILHIWSDQDNTSFDLTRVGKLFRLRYLKVECNITVDLPDKIQELQYLETLQVDGRLFAVPSDIGHLKKLRYLRLPSMSNVSGLGMLCRLEQLHLTFCTEEQVYNLEDNMNRLALILEKLTNLRSLILASVGTSVVNTSSKSVSCGGLSRVSPAPPNLERLELLLPLICKFPSIPKWFNTLDKLCSLKIAVRELSNSDIDIIKDMTALTALALDVYTAFAEMVVFRKAGFPALKYFRLRCSEPLVKFEADAMPNLRKLKLVFNALEVKQQGVAPICIEHLAGLQDITVKIGITGAVGTKSISNDPRNPEINEQLVNWNFFGEGDQIRATNNVRSRKKVQTMSTKGVEDENKQPDSGISELPQSSTSTSSSSTLRASMKGRKVSRSIAFLPKSRVETFRRIFFCATPSICLTQSSTK